MNNQINAVSSRYEAYKQGLLGVLASALYGYEPLSSSNALGVELSANSVFLNASRDLSLEIDKLFEVANAESHVELQKHYDDDIRALMNNDALNELHSAVVQASKDTLLNRMKLDAREVVTSHRNFRLKSNIRELQENVTQEHIIFSEREKLLLNFNPKQTDSLGRKYHSSLIVDRTARNMAYRINRLSMLFGLISLNHEYGQLQGGSKNGELIKLEDYFELESGLFHFASQTRLMPSVAATK